MTQEDIDKADDANDRRAAVVELIVALATMAARIKADDGVAVEAQLPPEEDSTVKTKANTKILMSELRLELAAVKMSELRKRAVEAGATPEQLDDADDADDQREALVSLVLAAAEEAFEVGRSEGAIANKK